MRFVTDGMLGKLTRWLRMLGHDVEYANNINDQELIRIAKEEKRILLTSDLQLYQQATTRNVEAFLVEGKNEVERLSNIAKRFSIKLEIDISLAYCSKCNGKIEPVAKESLIGKIPKNTFTYYNEFWKCQKCGQIYWRGAHWKRISKTLEEAKQLLKS
ncbi:MAG: Mut7-C RNAse domain-containing protein [Candidatus Bathyarchaeia archaeon]